MTKYNFQASKVYKSQLDLKSNSLKQSIVDCLGLDLNLDENTELLVEVATKLVLEALYQERHLKIAHEIFISLNSVINVTKKADEAIKEIPFDVLSSFDPFLHTLCPKGISAMSQDLLESLDLIKSTIINYSYFHFAMDPAQRTQRCHKKRLHLLLFTLDYFLKKISKIYGLSSKNASATELLLQDLSQIKELNDLKISELCTGGMTIRAVGKEIKDGLSGKSDIPLSYSNREGIIVISEPIVVDGHIRETKPASLLQIQFTSFYNSREWLDLVLRDALEMKRWESFGGGL